MSLVVIGPVEEILRGMFRQQDAHVVQWRHWRFLFDRGIVDNHGIILVGRCKGQPMRSR